ncbi:MAG: hypothetical protein ABJG15_03060 [Hyphomonadaceae bacterium]
MDIRELGACAFVVIGGVTYAISSGGLKDALTEDVRHVTEVAYDQRADYMNGIVEQFTVSFDAYIVQTETYDYVGHSRFGAQPSRATFTEIVTSDEPVPSEEIASINTRLEAEFCGQEEIMMFSETGWNYSFTLQDSTGRRLFSTVCRSTYSGSKDKAVS